MFISLKSNREIFNRKEDRKYHVEKRKFLEVLNQRKVFSRNLKVVSLIGLLSAFSLVITKLYSHHKLNKYGIETTATVVGLKKGKYLSLGLDGGQTYNRYLKVSFLDNHNKLRNSIIEISFNEYKKLFIEDPKVGDTVKIRYNSSKPKQIYLTD